jgi:hypothetical protein
MFNFSDAHHFRKTVAGFCMVVAPLLMLVAMVIHPERQTDEGAQLAVIRDNQDAWYATHLLLLIGVILAVPVVLGLMHMLRERETAWGHVGGGFAMLGLMALFGLVTINGLVAWQMAVGDGAEMTALWERLTDTAGVFLPIYLMSLLFALGMVVLAGGLYRARAVQSWMALFAAIGAVALTVGAAVASGVVAIVGAALLLVGLGSIGRMVLAESDEEWEHTPEYKGFRPLAGMQ